MASGSASEDRTPEKPYDRLKRTAADTSNEHQCRAPFVGLSLPEKLYEYAEWKVATVNIDYHIEVDKHYYSVPFRLVREKLDVRLTAHTVEAFQKGERVATHLRSFIAHQRSTLTEHMPLAHQNYLEWTPSRIRRWAQKIGPHTAALIEKIIETRTHPEQAYRSCLGILRLEKHYPKSAWRMAL